VKLLTLDVDYLQPRFACAYLRIESGRAAFIETGTNSAVPSMLHALRTEGLDPGQVEAIIVTHVHLDHAGGASRLMRECPNAVLYAHPRAARHLVDPSKLLASARQVYGEKRFESLYGEILSIPAERVRTVEDGGQIKLSDSALSVLHTRGHANHHFCVVDPTSDAVFTGDSFGLAYPDLQRAGLFIFPSTSPTDFDPQAAVESAERIRDCGVTRAMLTHFGEIGDLAAATEQLREDLEFSVGLLSRAASEPADRLRGELSAHLEARAARIGLQLGPDDWDLLKLDLDLNIQGIAFAASRSK
jgi:glyoxylase-like metal-dependent hydrolase (beta-lactamase superfamily II)